MGTAQEHSQAGDAAVVLLGHLHPAVLFRILVHGADLVHNVGLATLARAHLLVQDRPAALDQGQDGHEGKKEDTNEQADEPAQNVKHPLASLKETTRAGFADKRADEPVGFKVMDGHPPKKFFIQCWHGHHFHTAFLGIQDGLEGLALHFA